MKAFKKSRILLQAVLDDNYKIGNGYEIAPALRDEIETFLNRINEIEMKFPDYYDM